MLRKLFAKLRKTLGSEPEPSAKVERSEHPTRRSHAARQSNKPSPRHSHDQQHPRGGQGRPARQEGRGGEKSRHAGPARTERHGGHGGHGGAAAQQPRENQPREPRRQPVSAPPPPEVPNVETPFKALGLSNAIAFAVQEKGYSEPTPIQQQAIPIVLSGRDVIGSAQTGTGKTAAFALPILQRLGQHGRLRCLILEPTRELALQVEEAFKEYSKYTNLRTTVVYGGVGYGKQREDLARGMDILAATPGRLLDHMEQGDVSLNDIEILVLDEVDRMLDMGFLPDVRRIVQRCPASRQTLFFTATLPPEIAQLAGWALREPVEVNIGQRRSPAETISHAFYPVVASQKFELLEALLKQTDYKSVLIFTRTKFGADRIARRLHQSGQTVGVLHSARSQTERVDALNGFKSGKFEILVATDIAARGLDIAGVSHVINYDVPQNPEDYVHRIGRTGRAQATGDAFTLVTEDDVRDARSIERFIGTEIERKKIEGFEYIYSALFDESAQASAVAKPASRLHRGVRR
ncbi:ATP-dependent helicase [Opitutaceae bacterium EW11]|nr:ATP-dependent helicase [Opitutaceae bacterium EW11]